MDTFVFFKTGQEDQTLKIPLALEAGESVVSATVASITPSVAPVMTAAVVAGPADNLELAVGAGAEGTTYGVAIQVQTSLPRTLVITAAVSVGSSAFAPYRTQDPESYTDLVGSLEAGQSALSTCIFVLPAAMDPRGGIITWEVLDSDGVVYSAGNAFEFTIQSNGLSKVCTGRAIVTVPSDTPPTIERPYQVRYSLHLPNAEDGQQDVVYSYETLTVTGLDVVPEGTYPAIELHGDDAQVSIVLDKAYDQVFVELYADNTLVTRGQIKEALRVSSGYRYAGALDTTPLKVSLIPYRVIWKYSQAGGPTFRESTSLWVTNPSILSAIEDCTAKINKARATLYGTSDHQFPAETVMLWLRRAADAFNGAYGNFTSFTFLNAKGVIREFWLLYAEMFALESQYLAEGEKAFNFQGAAIQLDVDRTQYLDSAAAKIQQRLDSELKALKQNLIIKGVTRGAGDVDPQNLQRGAIGAVGITISQASPWSGFRPVTPFH